MNAPASSITKVAKYLCFATAFVSFMGCLPVFAPYFVFKPNSFVSGVPKFWILLTSSFYCEKLSSTFFQCFFIVMCSRTLEPILGSREFLRTYLINAFYSNILLITVIGMYYLFSNDGSMGNKVYDVSSAPLSALFIALANIYRKVEIPTPCGSFPLRYMAFISFCISALTTLVDSSDSFLSTFIGSICGFIYVKWLQPHENVRGSPEFTFLSLIPGCKCCSPQAPDEEIPENNVPLNREAPRPPQGQSPFSGRSRTIGNL